MPTVNFLKHAVSRPLADSLRRRIPFDDIGDDTGLIVLDTVKDAKLVGELNALNGKLGVKRITDLEADELKKKCSAVLLAKNSRAGRGLGTMRIDNFRGPQVVTNPAAGASEPLSIPDSIPAPKRGGRKAKAIATADLAPQPQAAAPLETVDA